MVNVLILTEGGAESGYGHLSRCLALSQAFKDFDSELKVKLIVRADKRAKEFLKSSSADFISSDWLRKTDRIQELVDEKTIVIIDSYQAPRMFYESLRISKYKPYVVAIDDYNRIDYNVDAVINYSVGDNHDIGIIKRKGVKYLLGSKYILLRKEFYEKHNKKINKTIKDILICLGGSDCKMFIMSIINLLADYDFNLHVVSPNKILHDDLTNGSKVNVYSVQRPRDMCSLMLKVDLCISGGGQMLNELASLGVPTIAICLARNQMENIGRWQKTEFLEYAGWHLDKDILPNIKMSLDRMKTIETRKRKAALGIKASNVNGRFRIIRSLLSDFYGKRLTFRRAKIDDAKDVYELSNDPLVRKVSTCSKKIEWLHHLSWMEERLEDSNHIFYIVSDSKYFYGQVRFNIDPSTKDAVISISLHRNIRGMGLGPLIINKTVKELFKMRKDVDVVSATIKDNNVPSITSFKNSNFQLLKDLKVDGNKLKLFVRRREEEC